VLDFGVRIQGGHVRASLDRTLHTACMQHFPPAKHCASVRKRDRWGVRCAVIGVRHTSSATDERAAVAASTTAAINKRPILQLSIRPCIQGMQHNNHVAKRGSSADCAKGGRDRHNQKAQWRKSFQDRHPVSLAPTSSLLQLSAACSLHTDANTRTLHSITTTVTVSQP